MGLARREGALDESARAWGVNVEAWASLHTAEASYTMPHSPPPTPFQQGQKENIEALSAAA